MKLVLKDIHKDPPKKEGEAYLFINEDYYKAHPAYLACSFNDEYSNCEDENWHGPYTECDGVTDEELFKRFTHYIDEVEDNTTTVNQGINYKDNAEYKKRLAKAIPGTHVCIHFNDEIGHDIYSVTFADDFENWVDSFDTLSEAEEFIKKHKWSYDKEIDFSDSRNLYGR